MAVTIATLFFGHKVLGMPFDYVTGIMSGIQTQSACLAFASAQAKNEKPDVAYAAVYPAAIISKIILAQLLVSLIPLARGAETPPGSRTSRAAQAEGDDRDRKAAAREVDPPGRQRGGRNPAGRGMPDGRRAFRGKRMPRASRPPA